MHKKKNYFIKELRLMKLSNESRQFYSEIQITLKRLIFIIISNVLFN